ncbi:Di-copper centre-containing protein [Decorospora gaudefroyi]|uniref:Di-copper centre-containing protein n=1 Tax=Decorospora gaudefroyi TaxID=184978 RepID=A0A6A5K5U6_9PLEO|nr:Di-copper centre-containing protein [Decorospora gaudefroyi]
MRSGIFSAALAVVAGVSALPAPQETPASKGVAPLPLNIFDAQPKFVTPIPLEVAKEIFKEHNRTHPDEGTHEPRSIEKRARCSNVRVRVEWDSYPDSNKQAFVDSIKCLMSRPASGQFGQSRSRYEDLVALHQTLTPNVHQNSKFLLWHRYLLWTFEDMLRTECGLNVPMPWFDETRYPGRFSTSSVFSSRWFGGIALGGNCVRDGQFANLNINVGPGPGNQQHCLSRNGDGAKTAYCNSDYVNQCNAYGDFAGMASCAESGPHAWGHNGIGAVMSDTYGSPGDPIFWLHHAFVDRNFRIWQNMNSARVNSINGNDAAGNPLTLDTQVNVWGMRPTVRIRDILDTQETTLCYKYNY